MLVDDFLARSAVEHPDKTAVVADGLRLGYRELDARVNRTAWALQAAGVTAEDRVAIYLPNGMDAITSMFAVLRAGGAFVLVHPSTRERKLAFLLSDCSARALIAPHGSAEARRAAANAASVRGILTSGEGPRPDVAAALREIHLDAERDTFDAAPPPRDTIDMDLAAIIYTSGSTGRPKGVTMTHRNVVSAAESVTTYVGNVPEDVILNVLPMSFDYGLYQALIAARVGATLVSERSFAFPFQIVKRIAEEGVTGFPVVPTIVATLLQMQDLDPAAFDSVRYLTNTAAALPPGHLAPLRRLFRNARIYSMYGVTECHRVSYLPPEELDRRPTSVGRAMPNEQVWIEDADGRTVGPGEAGELVVRGANVMQGYWGLPEETERVLRPGRRPGENVLRTGDLFRMDEQGFLYFVSRTDEIIKSGGQKVSPREVEDALYETPDVREAKVVGRPDPLLGEAIHAYVVLRDGSALTERDLLRDVALRLESFMRPHSLEIRASLPRTSTGKVRAPERDRPADDVAARVCTRCVLPETFPALDFDAHGICNVCRQGKRRIAESRIRARAIRKFEAVVEAVRDRPGPHCILALSGGKDSSFTLLELRERFGLDVLAITFDNGFLSESALSNARRMAEAVDASHLVVKPRISVLRSLFANAASDCSSFPAKSLERASGVCCACMALVKGAIYREAIERGIPVVAYGWSPGQAPASAAVFRMNASMLRQMHETTIAPALALVDGGLEQTVLEERHFADPDRLPVSVNPLAFLEYDEEHMLDAIRERGWTRPADTDPNSTNCRLNAFANHVHLTRHGYHPYAPELAELVRAGVLEREEALRRTREPGRRSSIEDVARELGVGELV